MRGVFTCGVLDFFMDNGIRFPFTVGSAQGLVTGSRICRGSAEGPGPATSTLWPNISMWASGISERIIPYDYPAYAANPDRYAMVTTNCLTGQAEYFEEKIPASAGSHAQP